MAPETTKGLALSPSGTLTPGGTVKIKNDNDQEKYDNSHPLPSLPELPRRRLGFDLGQELEQESESGQKQYQEHKYNQDEPLNNDLTSSSSDNNRNEDTSQQKQQQAEDGPDVPPPLPSKSTFYITHSDMKEHSFSYNYKPPTSSPTFLDQFMARHPKIARHRRRFAALIFTSVTLFLLLIVLLAVTLTRKHSSDHGDGGFGQPGNEWGDESTATAEELRKHNAGLSPAPINHSNAPGWTSQGQGDGTFYDPSIKNGVGQFQMGACEFPYINSVKDMIAALNKPDFGNFARASNSPACGQCLQVTGPNGTVTVQVIDMCPGCNSGDVDLTPGAFAKIASLDAGRVRISWRRC
ncbi:hypothetical protein FBU30_001661 [Linnemannia zychae]|nr:hypothetical protein FBU30_001661 [Linnemannia zychae]